MALKVNFAHQISHKTQKIRSIFFYFLLDFGMKFKIKLSKNQKWPKHMFMKIKNPSVNLEKVDWGGRGTEKGGRI